MAAASLTISHVREMDIDFSLPYVDLGLKFIMKVSIYRHFIRVYCACCRTHWVRHWSTGVIVLLSKAIFSTVDG